MHDCVAADEGARKLALVEGIGDPAVQLEPQDRRSGLGPANDRDDIGPPLEVPLLDEPAADEPVRADDRDPQRDATASTRARRARTVSTS